ncbi:hypothetical protein DM860_001059 [Cuscuta australis]|uniref:Protein MON2 homolog n=1 Tax=Cuscuta australis TaxID=267555 RepID=A0A328DWI7_9ASTE|nr:hypothetical protein DM860_001059 [Cuscuta australis]
MRSLEQEFTSGTSLLMRNTLTKAGKLGLILLEDLASLAASGSANWLGVSSLQRTFVLDILEFILSNYVVLFRTLIPYEEVLRHQICSILMTSLRTDSEFEGETGEPYFRRLVLRSVAHVIRLYSSLLITESEVFLSMLVSAINLDLPLWHRILVLEILRGFCVEAHTLRILFQNFDMNPKNTNVVASMVESLARVVSSIQFQDTCEESLEAVAGMFTSKSKGVEWSLDSDASNTAVLVASEAHAVTLAIEGLLGIVFAVATLTDEAVDVGELESPRFEVGPPTKCTGKTAMLCTSMVDSMWLTILDALSFILTKSQGEAIVLEILKGYQAFTQSCGVLRAVEPLNSFLASLCKFTIGIPNEVERRSIVQSPGSKRSEAFLELRESIVLTPKNVQALRTLFNIAHRLHNVLGPSWIMVLETLAALDRAIHSPHAATQEVSMAVPKLTRDSSGQYSDFHILSSLNFQLFESSALMHVSAVKSLLSALRQLSHQSLSATVSFVQASNQKAGSISFAIERMLSVLVNNLHRVAPLWDDVIGHFTELTSSSNQHVRNLALNAMDQSICAVLGSEVFQEQASSKVFASNVRNSAVRTLFQILGSHGQKLSNRMWENCLCNYVFPTLDCASHMAATSSKAEWQGKELGTRGGKAVHMLIHHSRNTAQKQWDETLVLVLGGIARVLRTFFPLLRNISNFQSGWDSLLCLVENSILHGSKEVALAAINCLHSTIVSQSPKGNLPLPYLISVLDIYELVLSKLPNYSNSATSKVIQEILLSLGDLYVQAQEMFDSFMYLKLLKVLDVGIKQTKIANRNFEADYGHLPPLQRTILEILPIVCPANHIATMWPPFLGKLMEYLPGCDSSIGEIDDGDQGNTAHSVDVPCRIASNSPKKSENLSPAGPCVPTHMFSEKLIPVLADLCVQAPAAVKYDIFPDIIHVLGRCMTTRRDFPDGTLWRTAVETFNKFMVDDLSKVTKSSTTDIANIRSAKVRTWKAVADIYEIFLVGYCGRALPSNALSMLALKADESLEMNILDILGDKILNSQTDVPTDILQRLISTLDICASRTCSLPLETVELIPPHCTKFSLTCLQKLFLLSRQRTSDQNSTSSEVSKISIGTLLIRCEYILDKFLKDENELGDCPLPAARLEEVLFVLQELACLVLQSDSASFLPLHPKLKSGLVQENRANHLHLIVLFPSFSELVISREAKVRELVHVLLRLVTLEMGLRKLCSTS